MSKHRQRMEDLREQGEARNADRALAPLEARIATLEASLREIERVADEQTIPDRHGKMIEACHATCLGECVALARRTLRGDPLPYR